MHTRERTNRIMTLLQKSNGIRNDLKRASTGVSCSSEIPVHIPLALSIKTVPLSITITQKESSVLQLRTFCGSARNSGSIPRIDLNLFDKPSSDASTLSKRKVSIDKNEARSRPLSAGCNAFLYQTTKFTSNSFRGRRNSADTGNFVVSGSSLAKKRMRDLKDVNSGRKWVLYRGRSLFN